MAGAQAARDGASPRRHAAAAAACARRLLAVGAAARRAAAVCTTNRRQPPAAVSQGGGSGRMCGGHAVPEVPKNLAESAWRPASPRGQRHRPAHPQPHSRPKPTEQATTHPPLLPPHRAATQTRQAALTHHALAQADAQRLITAAVAANRLGQARAGCHHGGHLHQSNAVLARRQHPSWQTPPGWGAGACRRSRARRFAWLATCRRRQRRQRRRSAPCGWPGQEWAQHCAGSAAQGGGGFEARTAAGQVRGPARLGLSKSPDDLERSPLCRPDGSPPAAERRCCWRRPLASGRRSSKPRSPAWLQTSPQVKERVQSRRRRPEGELGGS